jgi:Domain of unknown function (DUF222)/HNH endonuclease
VVCAAQRELFRVFLEIEHLELWRSDGARDIEHWISMRYGISEWKARRWVAAAHALEKLPGLAKALASGRLGVDKVVELTRFATPEDEAGLLVWAARVSCARIRRRGDTAVREREADVRDVERGRSVSWWFYDEDRRFRLEAELSGADGAVVAKALGRLAERIPAMPGEEGPSCIDARRADALVALASARIARDPDRDRATVVVHMPLQALTSEGRRCEVEGGPVVSALAAKRLLCHGRLQTVVEGAGGRALGVGRISRDPPAWLLRQVWHRDKGCTFPGCGTRRFVEAHHIVWWRAGGRTDLANLTLICSFHHKLVHELGWSIRRRSDGSLEWCRPGGRVFRAGPSPPAQEDADLLAHEMEGQPMLVGARV